MHCDEFRPIEGIVTQTNFFSEQRRTLSTLSQRAMKEMLLLALGAGFYTLGSPPYRWSSAAWFALTPLFLVLRNKTPWAGFWVGFCYALLCCFGVTRWIYFASASYFHLPFPWDYVCTLAVWAVFGGVYTGVVAFLSCFVIRHTYPSLARGAVPALWVSIEAARAYWGFSWAILGYTQYRSLTLIQIADVTGVYGLSFLMALSSYVCAEAVFVLWQRPRSPVALRGFPWAPLAGVTVAVVSVWLYGVIRLKQYQHLPQFSPSRVHVALVRSQTLGPQRWQPEHYARTLLHYVSATRPGITQQKTELVVWPEFALGFPLNQTSLLRAQLSSFVQTSQAFFLVGAPRVEESAAGNQYYNSAYLLDPSGALVDVYDKIRLVPFAERRPFALPEFRLPNNGAPYEFTAGQRSTTFPLPQGTFGVVICYEATYPYLARRLVQNDAQFLVNISNDSWLAAGGTAAIEQHFSMVVFRAVETKRYVLRSATAGISGFIDPTGRPAQLSTIEEGVTLGEVFPLRVRTIYVRYGDWFVVFCIGFAMVAVWRANQHAHGRTVIASAREAA